jgi:hypothetical protein
VSRGVLAIERFGELDLRMRLPGALLQKLKDMGKVRVDTSDVSPMPALKC